MEQGNKNENPLEVTEGIREMGVEKRDMVVEKERVETNEIPRTIGLIGGISFIVGTIIGSGIFVSPKGVALNSGSIAVTLLNWSVCGIISLFGALCYAELGTVVRKSGADYIYLQEALGPWVSFQFSWIYNFVQKPGAQATFALTFSQYVTTAFFSDSCGYAPLLLTQLLALAVLMTLVAINSYSVMLASRIQIIFTVCKLIALLVIIIGGIVRLFQGHTEVLATGFEGSNTDVGLLFTGLYSGMFAYDGWNTANFMTEEIIDPSRNLPLSICIGVPITIVIYIFTNVSYFTVMNIQEMIDSPAVAMTWANEALPGVAWIMPIFVAMSCFGAANGSLFSGGRLMYAAARNNHLPSILGMVHVHKFSPVPAFIIIESIAVVFIFGSNVSAMIDFLGFTLWIFYALNFLSLILLRSNKHYRHVPRPIKIPILIPAFCFIFAVFLVLVPLVTKPQLGYFVVLLVIVVGYVLFIPFVIFKKKLPYMDSVTLALQMSMQLFVPATNQE